ncbi:TRAP transporter substrate-binding protein DctP [Chloroflexota bacterium]
MMKNRKVKWLFLAGMLVCLASLLIPAGCSPAAAPADQSAEMSRLQGEVSRLEGEVSQLQKAAAGAQPAPEKYSVKLHSMTPSATLAIGVIKDGFIPAAEAMSQGQLEFEFFEPGALVPSLEFLTALNDDVIQMAVGLSAYWESILGPTVLIGNGWPYSGESFLDAGTWWFDMGFLETIRSIYAEQGVHYVEPYIYSPGNYIFSTKPIRTVDDFKGLKIRAPGHFGKFFGKLGASPIFMPTEEVYVGLSTGTLDAVFLAPLVDTYFMGFHEAAKYVIAPPMVTTGAIDILAGQEWWNKLPDHLKPIIQQASAYSVERYNTKVLLVQVGVIKDMKEKGVEFITMPDSEVAKLKQVSLALVDELMAPDPQYAVPAGERVKQFWAMRGLLQ